MLRCREIALNKKVSDDGTVRVLRKLFTGSRSVRMLLLFACLMPFAACRQDMQDQPKMKPFRATSFFPDGLSSRPPVEGTVPRGFLRSDVEFFTGKKVKTGTSQPTSATAANPFADDVDVLPIPVTQDVLTTGRQRYDIFCAVCHGLTGYGDGMVVRRGFRRAASFHDDRLRQAPVGHFFDAITNGWGAMPSYAPQIPVQERWAIVAYIRALQLSQKDVQQAAPSASPTPSPASTGRHGP
jgi:mono/diheme cytochrome c family protein